VPTTASPLLLTMTERGLLVALEGSDGSGKSTQAKLLADRLDAVLTRQPGGTDFGAKVRSLILDPASEGISPKAEAMLFMADRAQLVSELVEPSLAAGKHVVSDRWAWASLVYQGHGRGLEIDELRSISDWAMDGLWPDLVILLDVSVEAGLARVQAQGDVDHFEKSHELQLAVVDGYRELARSQGDTWRVVDGTGDIESVADRVWTEVEQLVALRK
jgi:dTMP kinase